MRSLFQLPLNALTVSTVVTAHVVALVVIASVTVAAETRSRVRAMAPALRRWR